MAIAETENEKYRKALTTALNKHIKLGFNQDEVSGFIHGFLRGYESNNL